MPFGGQTLSLTHLTQDGVPDELGVQGVEEDTNNFPGCRHRPMNFQEKVDLGYDIATEVWRSTIPIGEYTASQQAKLLALKPQDYFYENGQKFQVQAGVQPHPDMGGRLFTATIISKRQIS